VLILVATLFDGALLSKMPVESSTQRGDFISLLRILGYLPTWILFSLLLVLAAPTDQKKRFREDALRITLTAMISGIVAETLKPIFRRPDPQVGNEGSWERAPLNDQWWDGTDFCFPSGHSAVAFGAAVAISRRWPKTTPLIGMAAIGCAITRIYERGHHPSDVIASLLIALCVSRLMNPNGRVIPD